MNHEKMHKFLSKKCIVYPENELIEFIEQEAKKEVFDDIEKNYRTKWSDGTFDIHLDEKMLSELKNRQLNTLKQSKEVKT